MTKAKTKSSRKVGAQPGNTNAIKHGAYSSRPVELNQEEIAKADISIDYMLAKMRIAADRIFEYSEQLEDPMDAIKALGTFGQTAKTISGMLKTKFLASGSSDDAIARDAINAILQVYKEKYDA